VLGRSAAEVLIGRIGRHRLDAQQREQAIEAGIEVAIDPLQHRVEMAHDDSARF
jgi:hypothetical protein